MRNKKGKEVSRIILKGLLVAGAVAIASTSPYFVPMAMPKILKYAKYKIKRYKDRKRFERSFSYLKNKGMIEFRYKGKQLYISLTKEGKKKAKSYSIDELRIKKPKKWDGKWRILIFDVEEKNKIKREGLRGKLRELELYQLQKSVWVCPYEFKNEIEILREFFNFSKSEMKTIGAFEVEEDWEIKRFFGIKEK